MVSKFHVQYLKTGDSPWMSLGPFRHRNANAAARSQEFSVSRVIGLHINTRVPFVRDTFGGRVEV